jgi:putative transcriptional regulator
MTGSLKGHLLVATPRLRDPNFDRTVVLVLEHSEEGAAGVVLNRPSQAEVAGSLPGWDSLAGEPAVFFAGGPVTPTGFIGLARLTSTGAVGPVDLAGDPADAAEGVAELRIFAGYAGWGPGQLEFEIGEGAWFVVDALPDDALSPAPSRLWSAVLRRQGGRLALLSNYPEDVASN